jgi:hypothetical protein
MEQKKAPKASQSTRHGGGDTAALLARARGVSRRDSLAKYAAAFFSFFKLSRAIRGLASSAFRRAISICAALTALPVSSRNQSRAAFVDETEFLSSVNYPGEGCRAGNKYFFRVETSYT